MQATAKNQDYWKGVKILTSTPEEKLAALHFASLMSGLPISDETLKYMDEDPRGSARDYPIVHCTCGSWSGTRSFDGKVTPFKELFKTVLEGCFDETVIVPLNNEYEAEVSQNKVRVGCQTFTFEAVEKLAEAVAQVKKGKS